MIDVTLDLVPAAHDAAADVAVVIDVLRMTTTAAVLTRAGARRIWVVADVAEARRVASERSALLFGERGGVALAGFDGGNSPLEVRPERVADRDVVLCTTNGSAAVATCAPSAVVVLGAVVNATAVARCVATLAPRRLHVVCAGTDGRPSIDDVAGAASVLRALLAIVPSLALDDAATLALAALDQAGTPDALVAQARHARTLRHLGMEDDVTFAGRLDALERVPMRRLAGGAFEAVG